MAAKSFLFGGAFKKAPMDEETGPGEPGDMEEEASEGEGPSVPPELLMAAEDFLSAVQSGDARQVATAWMAMDSINDSLMGEPGQGEGGEEPLLPEPMGMGRR